jgi:hypothetical protein
MTAAEERVTEVFAAAERAAASVAGDTEARARDQAAAGRAELVRLRGDLAVSAAALALRFEAILDLIEEAEAELARRAGEPRPPRREDRFGGLRVTLRERQRITFAQEAAAPGDGVAGPPPAEAAPPRRRRWWRLWMRDAA